MCQSVHSCHHCRHYLAINSAWCHSGSSLYGCVLPSWTSVHLLLHASCTGAPVQQWHSNSHWSGARHGIALLYNHGFIIHQGIKLCRLLYMKYHEFTWLAMFCCSIFFNNLIYIASFDCVSYVLFKHQQVAINKGHNLSSCNIYFLWFIWFQSKQDFSFHFKSYIFILIRRFY